MLDTTSINFAMGKISQGWEKIAPTITGIGEKYVRYTVINQLAGNVVLFIASIIILIVFLKFLKQAKRAITEKDDPFGWIAASIFSGIAVIVFLVIGLVELKNTILAVTCPEMFTVNHVIELGRNRGN